MKNTYLLWLSLFVTGGTSAQHGETWYNGSVTLSSNHVLVGKLFNHALADFIVFQSDEEKITIPAHKIKSFRYYDPISNINRQFKSIKDVNPFQFRKLYEVVIQGEVNVVRRPKVLIRTQLLHEINDYDYFIEYKEELVPIKKFRTKVYPKLMRERPIEIEQFVSLHHLNINEMKAALLILKEYNQLQSPKELFSRLD